MGGMTYTSIEAEKLTTAEYYGKALHDLGVEHPEVVALTADLAKSTKISAFAKEFPDRLINVGIAEQNMFGIAAGLAKNGFVPFASTFAIFAAARSLDQIHSDICYQNVNAKIIATHSGTSFGQAGSTHHAICDMAVIRSMPNITLICPADGIETATASIHNCLENCFLINGLDCVHIKNTNLESVSFLEELSCLVSLEYTGT